MVILHDLFNGVEYTLFVFSKYKAYLLKNRCKQNKFLPNSRYGNSLELLK